jgi:hypothetical protein
VTLGGTSPLSLERQIGFPPSFCWVGSRWRSPWDYSLPSQGAQTREVGDLGGQGESAMADLEPQLGSISTVQLCWLAQLHSLGFLTSRAFWSLFMYVTWYGQIVSSSESTRPFKWLVASFWCYSHSAVVPASTWVATCLASMRSWAQTSVKSHPSPFPPPPCQKTMQSHTA